MRDALGAVQSVLVLGGTSEIALASVRALLAERAATVVLAGRDPARLEEAAVELRAAGATSVDTAEFDAEDVDSHAAFVARAWEAHGDFDLVLVAFGVLGDAERDGRDPTAAVAVARTNYLGAVSVMVSVANRLREQGHGTIVVLSSVAAERPRAANFVYGSTKAGLDSFAQGLGDSLAGTGVRVLVVRPGFVRTRMTAGLKPAPLATTPDVVAQVVVDGLRGGAHTVWAPSPVRWLMTVLRHLPRPVFRRLPG